MENENLNNIQQRVHLPRHPKGRYCKISADCRAQVLREAEIGGDWKATAAENGIKYKTAHDWLRKGSVDRKQRGGKRHFKLNNEIIEEVIGWLEVNPQMSLRAMRERLIAQRNIDVSTQTISKQLDGRLISCKKIHIIPQGVNTVENKILRRTYVERLLEHIGTQKFLLLMNETNFNLF